ncbi:hypothetical protein G9U51_00710 [Calidifontibacter sp. DB0510]|uniref:Uncharacterized protein n=1 Tax=Metallococcus carri TaxID=1656884 RepID=A0A967AYT0_9MICO|nr:hypothetical protein [Metallococcus carri]NHN54305.1 hypothetical protein [Metallococcus carri]NOP36855.1 hypothetical protein [Calidifontibacter sp. DB2511S]
MTGAPVRLTDEELVLLNAEHPGVVLPFLDALPAADRRVAVLAAHRALIAHGTPVSSSGALQVPEALVALLRLRRSAPRLLAVDRISDEAVASLYLHDLGEVVIAEEVDSSGLHAFAALATPEELPASIERFAALAGSVDGSGRPFTVDLVRGQDLPPRSPWGEATVRLEATVRRAGQEREVLLGVLAGDRGTWVTTTPADGRTLSAEPVAVVEVPHRIAALLGAADRAMDRMGV